MTLTAHEVEAASRRRARVNRTRLTILAGFVLLAVFVGAFLLQRQQNILRDLIHEQTAGAQRACEQRRANVLVANGMLDDLAEIERHNQVVTAKIRRDRIAVYTNAHLAVPVCR